jgi:hypothetical protein
MPPYQPNADANQREATLYAWQTHTSQYLTCQRIEEILLSMLENTIEATYLTGIHDSAHGFGARTLIDVFCYLFATYGSIGPDEILRNHQTMTTPVDANPPIAILFKQIKDCQKFAATGQVAITPAQVLKAAKTLILQTGEYTSAYCEWIALDPNAKTYHNFKVRMTAEYQLQNTMTTTARDAGYHHAIKAYQTPADEESLASAAQDFAAASAADSSAFQQLTTTNGNLNTQLAHMAIQNQQLQQQVTDIQQHVMFLATAAPPPQHQRQPGRGSRGRTIPVHSWTASVPPSTIPSGQCATPVCHAASTLPTGTAATTAANATVSTGPASPRFPTQLPLSRTASTGTIPGTQCLPKPGPISTGTAPGPTQ